MTFSSNLTSISLSLSLIFFPPQILFLLRSSFRKIMWEEVWVIKSFQPLISATIKTEAYIYQSFYFLGPFSLQMYKMGSKILSNLHWLKGWELLIKILVKIRLRKALGLVGNWTVLPTVLSITGTAYILRWKVLINIDT